MTKTALLAAAATLWTFAAGDAAGSPCEDEGVVEVVLSGTVWRAHAGDRRAEDAFEQGEAGALTRGCALRVGEAVAVEGAEADFGVGLAYARLEGRRDRGVDLTDLWEQVVGLL